MNIFSQDTYKKKIKFRVKELQSKRPGLTLKKLASMVPLQYTYLSKALSDSGTHLNEDHIYSIGKHLEFSTTEIDFLILQRSADVSQSAERREFLIGRIEDFIKNQKFEAQLKSSSSVVDSETQYLLDPYCVIVHLALDLEQYLKSPRSLCTPLGISPERLKKILFVLDKNEIIKLDPYDNFKIAKHFEKHIHIGKDNPVMRVMQSLLRTSIGSQLNRLDEKDKHCLQATFPTSKKHFEEIKLEFQDFLKKVEKIVKKSPRDGVYQINFDFFRWL